jgi:ribosome-associated translation inhibitor RaiA
MAQHLEVRTEGDVPRAQVEEVRKRLAALEGYVSDPPISIRLTLRPGGGSFPKREYVADASVLFEGRLLAAHAGGPTAAEAAEVAAERLRRQLRRVVGADVARRNEPAVIEAALASLEPHYHSRPQERLKPPDEREIVHRRTYADRPKPTLEAVADLLDLDQLFYLFRHVRTNEDVVVYRHDDRRIGLIHPQGSALADENEIVVTEPSRYSEPLMLKTARAEMDLLNHRFLYFVDAEDGRGKVLYLRHDGDYGLVLPE